MPLSAEEMNYFVLISAFRDIRDDHMSMFFGVGAVAKRVSAPRKFFSSYATASDVLLLSSLMTIPLVQLSNVF